MKDFKLGDKVWYLGANPASNKWQPSIRESTIIEIGHQGTCYYLQNDLYLYKENAFRNPEEIIEFLTEELKNLKREGVNNEEN